MSLPLESATNADEPPAATTHGFRPLRVLLPTLVALLAVQAWIQWHAREVSLPRYCDDTLGTIAILERIITEPNPAGDESRRPYIVAAKLLFIVPRTSDEPARRYLERVRSHLAAQCR